MKQLTMYLSFFSPLNRSTILIDNFKDVKIVLITRKRAFHLLLFIKFCDLVNIPVCPHVRKRTFECT